MACAMDDGRVATRSASGGDAGTRRAREGGAKRAIVSAEDGEDGACGAVAVCFDGESVVYVARAAVDEAVDALRHPARARATSWRGGTLATLCADGALRLWMRANGRDGVDVHDSNAQGWAGSGRRVRLVGDERDER